MSHEPSRRQQETRAIGDRLFSSREGLLSFWQECAEQVYPERATFTTTNSLGKDYSEHLTESYPVWARRELGNAFAANLRQRSQQWFEFGIHGREDLDGEDKATLQKWQKIQHRLMYDPAGQFVRATNEADHDFVTFGNAVISAQLRKMKDGLLYQAWHLRDCAWLINDEAVVDHIHRKFALSARNAVTRWGDACHPRVKEIAAKDPGKELTFRHAVLPFEQYGENLKGKGEFASLIYDAQNGTVVEAKRIGRFPYVVPRWHALSDSQYAFSPCLTIGLADMRQLQAMARTIIEGAEKAVDPPMVATREAVAGGVNLMAGGLTWVEKDYDERMGESLRPLDMGKNVGLGFEVKKDMREMIANHFFLNRLNLPDTRDKTAYETRQIVQENIRGLLPLFEPVEAAYNAPLLDLTFGLLMDNGAFGRPEEIPEGLQGREIKLAFRNPLQETMERQKAAIVMEGMNIVGMAAKADQSVLKVANLSRATHDALEGMGWEAEWLAAPETADEANADGDLARDAQAVAGGVQQAAGAVQGAAGAASAIGQLLGQMQQGPPANG